MTQSVAKRYTTTEYGKQKIFAVVPRIEVLEIQVYWKNAELLIGRLALIGLFAAVHNYAIFGWIIPGIG